MDSGRSAVESQSSATPEGWRSSAIRGARPRWRSALWRCMSSTFRSITSPKRDARAMTASGRSVCKCTFTTAPAPAMSSDEPKGNKGAAQAPLVDCAAPHYDLGAVSTAFCERVCQRIWQTLWQIWRAVREASSEILGDHGHPADHRRRRIIRRRFLATRRPLNAVEKVDKALGAGVDDVVARKHQKLPRSTGECFLSALAGHPEQVIDSRSGHRMGGGGPSPGPHDRDDGTFHWRFGSPRKPYQRPRPGPLRLRRCRPARHHRRRERGR